MSEIYERRLKKEFDFLQRLQRHPNTRGIIDIFYKERVGGNSYKSVLENPSSPLYPNNFRIKYTFPVMYVGKGQVKNNWSHAFILEVPESILMNPEKNLGDEFEIEGGAFPQDNLPYNGHISPNWVCIGALWQVANQGFGIWYFIVSLGALLNQEKTEMDPNDTVHLNSAAFDYWKYDREMQPNNIIKWPYNLDMMGRITPPNNPGTNGRSCMKITPRSNKSESTASENSAKMRITKRTDNE